MLLTEKLALGWTSGRGQIKGERGSRSRPEVVVSHPAEEPLPFAAARQVFVLFFAALFKTHPELGRLRQRKQPQATGTFLIRGGKIDPELKVLLSLLTIFTFL